MNRKPKWYENLRKWREENGYTTEEWQTYVGATVLRNSVSIIAAYLLGAFVAWFFG